MDDEVIKNIVVNNLGSERYQMEKSWGDAINNSIKEIEDKLNRIISAMDRDYAHVIANYKDKLESAEIHLEGYLGLVGKYPNNKRIREIIDELKQDISDLKEELSFHSESRNLLEHI